MWNNKHSMIYVLLIFCLTFYINISSRLKLCPHWKRNILTFMSLKQLTFLTIFRSLQLKVVQRFFKSSAKFFKQVRTILNLRQMKIFVFLQERLYVIIYGLLNIMEHMDGHTNMGI